MRHDELKGEKISSFCLMFTSDLNFVSSTRQRTVGFFEFLIEIIFFKVVMKF